MDRCEGSTRTGARVQLKAHAFSASMRKAIEIAERFRETAEVGEDIVQRAGRGASQGGAACR
ncbi:MAG: hypothetical protein IPO30_00820 [Hyphomonadaceae bacterium]|nr:hypothetical protein [Hyphomonadaceae bacterium]